MGAEEEAVTEEITEEDRDEIARQVREGNTSGYIDQNGTRIYWELKTEKFEH